MTLVEWLTVAAGTIGTFTATHFTTAKKISASVGPAKPGDDSLRDLIMKLDGKLDANHDATTGQIEKVEQRLTRVEQRVFTPPNFMAIQAARAASKSE